jgi:hypothetical protein
MIVTLILSAIGLCLVGCSAVAMVRDPRRPILTEDDYDSRRPRP